ncbi:coenzyme F420 hydrogenase, partial [Klebsiella grimontii]|nr:coenzyme F420 hydrogenase [Klebsiella grimontii]
MNIDDIINDNFCTGCGVCISEDKSNASYMDWDEDGILRPILNESSDRNLMERVCPFNIEN